MNTEPEYQPETLAVHAGHLATDSVNPVAGPIVLSSTYVRDASGQLPEGYMYSRLGNPNRTALEECLAVLERGEACAAFASGSAATMAIFQSLAPGDHVLQARQTYYGTLKVAREIMERWNLEVSLVDMTDIAAVRAGFRENTKLMWIETPSNPLITLTDIAPVAAVAREHQATLVVDNTFATPLLQQPILLGADLVMHATSKYIAGHSDVVGGAVIARSATAGLFPAIRKIQTAGGAVPSPFDCWLTLRGIRTLPVRLRAQCENAARIAQWLAGNSKVHTVHYPGLSSHPWHDIAVRQMKHAGAMLSFQVTGGAEAALRIAANTRVFTRATSLGGVESLIEHRASVEQGTNTPDDLLRLSVGIEHGDDLVADLEQAMP
ncbi:MAG: trans-sulfuration enzyme family protein [Candidatus Sumerlaeaceae bacterium]